MSEEKSKVSLKGKGRLVWAAVCIAPFLMTSAFVNPALASVKAAFPDAPTFLVQNISTAEALTIFLVGLFFGALVNKFSSRKLAIVGIVIILVFDIVCALSTDLLMLIIARGVVGIGAGLMYPLNNRVIFELFEDADERSRVMGLKVTMINVCSVGFSLAAGVLIAIFNWPIVFWALCILAIPAIVVIVCLPEIPPKPKSELPKVHIPGKCWFWLAYTVIANLFITAFMVGTALTIAGNGIGDPSHTGYVLAVMGVFGILSGLIYPAFRQLAGRWTMTVILVAYIISYFIAGNASSMLVLYLAGCLNGLCFGSSSAELVMIIQETAGEVASPRALGFYSSFLKLGSFLLPYVLALVSGLFGGVNTLVSAGYFAILVLVITVIATPMTLRKGGLKEAQLAQQQKNQD